MRGLMFCAAVGNIGEMVRVTLRCLMFQQLCVNSIWDSVCFVVAVRVLFAQSFSQIVETELDIWKDTVNGDVTLVVRYDPEAKRQTIRSKYTEFLSPNKGECQKQGIKSVVIYSFDIKTLSIKNLFHQSKQFTQVCTLTFFINISGTKFTQVHFA
jgi:hypothetical protein